VSFRSSIRVSCLSTLASCYINQKFLRPLVRLTSTLDANGTSEDVVNGLLRFCKNVERELVSFNGSTHLVDLLPSLSANLARGFSAQETHIDTSRYSKSNRLVRMRST
jgi:hypothetical protein